MAVFIAVLRVIFARATLFTTICLSCGGLGVVACLCRGLDPGWGFAAGASIPMAPCWFYFNSAFVLRREINRLKQLKEGGFISDRDYKQLRKLAVASYGQAHFGQPLLTDLKDE